MSDIAIHVEKLSKQYFLGEQVKYGTLRDSLVRIAGYPLRRLRGRARPTRREAIWALKDVSFTVRDGEVVGIIGRNGAGKTTLLKILSRITEPTAGYADIYGRVGSLLEVGTGFHLELTGRENIFLNGAILGMKRRDIERKFDEIVEFAGVEQFVDTPVKHYSTGMYLRLAFSVAAYLEPDILLVDEVLAVGDADFQKKCLGKMENVARAGRTVLFVSHNMAAVSVLCQQAIQLEQGQIVQIGPVADVIQAYLATAGSEGAPRRTNSYNPSAPVYIESATLQSVQQSDEGRTTVSLVANCHASRPAPFTVEWHLTSLLGQRLAFGSPAHFRRQPLEAPAGRFDVHITISDMPLGAGRYYFDLRLGDLREKIYYDVFDRAVAVDVESYDPYKTGRSFSPKKDFGAFHFPDQFTITIPAYSGNGIQSEATIISGRE
ncbi:MAG: polysaccharide ABC transporter ATP-binding protein [Chloroflexi bacterium]|nr:polysaccharide ABC transporter ATP-binding protein [Chloroflexota bacterium]MCI0645866.1 polysaccharide ABC transporter ATP-binding protein [Chloroflexota bacterium]MCI0725721.1 polysaccharide ABC transporter ATP-binding protein [Chloroflexota bacterium]